MVLGLPKWHAQKVVKKCPKSGQKRVPAKSGTIKTQIWLGFLTNRGGGLRPPPKNGRGGRAHFWLSIYQKPKQNWCYGPRFCQDPFLTTFWTLFDHFLGMSFGKAQNHSRTTFWPFLFLGTLGGHLGYNPDLWLLNDPSPPPLPFARFGGFNYFSIGDAYSAARTLIPRGLGN